MRRILLAAMAAGRWLDDAYGGQPRPGNAGRRLTLWMKWTWPVAVAAAVALTYLIGAAGWAVAAAAWFVSCAVPNAMDQTAKMRGHP